MMLMRDRSGRSGRRRGSQKPGTAIGLLMVSVGIGGEDGAGACACAAAIVAASKTAIAPPRTQGPLIRIIHRPQGKQHDHSIAIAADQPYRRVQLVPSSSLRAMTWA